MKTLIQGTALVILLTIFSCANDSQDLAGKLSISYTYDGQQVEMVGYILPSQGFTFVRGEVAKVDLCTTDDPSHNRTIITNALVVNFGKGSNSLYFEDNATMDQVEIYDDEGARITHEDKVKISGRVNYTAKGPKKKSSGSARKLIEKLKAENGDSPVTEGDGNDYTYEIVNVIITKL